MDNQIFAHVLFDQFEDRTNGPDNAFRWDGQAWIGNDMNRLWLKTEGIVSNGEMSDGDQEVYMPGPSLACATSMGKLEFARIWIPARTEPGAPSESKAWRRISSSLRQPFTSAMAAM